MLLLEVPLARDFTCPPRPCWAAVPSARSSSPANALSASSSTSPGGSLLFYFGGSCIHISFCGQVSPTVLTPLRHCWECSFHCSLQVCWEPKPGSAKTLTWSKIFCPCSKVMVRHSFLLLVHLHSLQCKAVLLFFLGSGWMLKDFPP